MQVAGRTIRLDSDGFMIDPSEWDAQVAQAIARQEGITELSRIHWEVISFVRCYWQEHQLAPPVRMICREVGLSAREMYRLFASGPIRGACRVAGLPRPDGCV